MQTLLLDRDQVASWASAARNVHGVMTRAASLVHDHGSDDLFAEYAASVRQMYSMSQDWRCCCRFWK